MHRTACLPEIDGFEAGRCPSHGSQVSLGFLDEMEERVSVLVGRGERRRERALERDERGVQVASMVRPPLSAREVAEGFGRFANSFASGFQRRVVDNRAGASERTLEQEARELDQAPAQKIVKRLGLAHIARERVGQNSSAPPFWLRGLSSASRSSPSAVDRARRPRCFS